MGARRIFVTAVPERVSSPGTFAIAQILAGANATGRWVGIQNAIANLAGIAPASPIIIEQTHHFTGAFVVAAGVSVLGLAGWVWMVPKVAAEWSTAPVPGHWRPPSARPRQLAVAGLALHRRNAVIGGQRPNHHRHLAHPFADSPARALRTSWSW
jgi:hypothetical protein